MSISQSFHELAICLCLPIPAFTRLPLHSVIYLHDLSLKVLLLLFIAAMKSFSFKSVFGSTVFVFGTFETLRPQSRQPLPVKLEYGWPLQQWARSPTMCFGSLHQILRAPWVYMFALYRVPPIISFMAQYELNSWLAVSGYVWHRNRILLKESWSSKTLTAPTSLKTMWKQTCTKRASASSRLRVLILHSAITCRNCPKRSLASRAVVCCMRPFKIAEC